MRISSIDVFRALTMLLMIFVNDLWSLTGIPGWMEHSRADVDFLGMADVVFPCFLFILGMAIPFAIENRLAKGESSFIVAKHIVIRSFALLVMGVFTVNSPEINSNASGINGSIYEIIMVIAFFLIWNVYPKSSNRNRYFFNGLQGLGVILLFWLAIIYKGNSGDSGQLVGFKPQWWGILGLIGWAYLGGALIYLLGRKKPWLVIISAWIFFTLFSIAGHAGWLQLIWPGGPHEWFVGNGAFHSFALAGVIGALLLRKYTRSENASKLIGWFVVLGIALFAGGWIARHFFIISKIWATPTWVFLCCAIAFVSFAAIYWIVDYSGKENWFTWIKPAGTSTLTCYLIPYLVYNIADLSGLHLPAFALTGATGIVKSILYTFMVVAITALIGKVKIKLKI